MNVKMYKFMYKILNDDIRDSEMLIDYAYHAKDEGEEEYSP